MIAANVAAAKALESKAAPVVYRIHEPPNREKLIALKDYLATFERKLALGQVITPALFNRMLKSIEDDVEKALIMEAVLRSQTQAYYGPRNAGHFGLSLGSYAHFTSPIRRYSDCWCIARWSMRSIWNSRRPVAICPRCRACRADRRIWRASAMPFPPPNAARWRPSARRSTAMLRHGSRPAWAMFSIAASPGFSALACSPRSWVGRRWAGADFGAGR
jgi:hypothetical protein